MSRTYTDRPPASARAARRAWDHFASTRAKGRRGIAELYYSPNYDFTRCPHWVCVLEVLEDDTRNWGFGIDCVTYAVPCYHLGQAA